MRAIIQRVSQAKVAIRNETVGTIGKGYLILLGVGEGDSEASADKLWSKIYKMRIFEDETGKTNLSLADIAGEVLVVSQFTLYANCKKGNRPSFTEAMEPTEAKRLYEYFLGLVKAEIGAVEQGEFGAMMDVSLINDGPFTIVLDTNEL